MFIYSLGEINKKPPSIYLILKGISDNESFLILWASSTIPLSFFQYFHFSPFVLI